MYDVNETLENALARNVRDTLREDIGRGDWTALLVPKDLAVQAKVTMKESAVLCGSAWFEGCILALDPSAKITWNESEGATVSAGSVVAEIKSSARALLSAERSALNLLQMLSGVATETRKYVQAIAGVSPNPNGCAVLDTRKTMAGLRQAQKYAVRVGGGKNHRMALWDGILIKENHIAAAGGIAAVLHVAESLNSGVPIQIEVESLAELEEALACGAKNILLDDFSFEDMAKAVSINEGRAILEVSGGVDLNSIRAIAATGVDRISIGKLTKDVRAVDLSMRIISE